MKKTISLSGTVIEYELEYKRVKNINLRILHDGSVRVSTNKHVPQSIIENFIISKSAFILKAISSVNQLNAIPKQQYFSDSELRTLINALCISSYDYFKDLGVKYPQIKFRKMVSCWGNCRPAKNILTFNTNLKYAPYECIRYVVLHEFTHFIHPNHTRAFYEELQKVCPDWNLLKNRLKTINIR